MNRIIILLIALTLGACSTGSIKKQPAVPEEKTTLVTNTRGEGPEIIVDLDKGVSFYYPLFAIWLEDADGKYIQTLYVAKAVGTGFFRYAKQEGNKWISGEKRAPQTLPYWSHKRGIIAADGLYVPDDQSSVPDAYSGATPITSFTLTSHADGSLPEKYKVMMEINQNWDWNEYWTNDRYPDDENYKISCQPALVYEAVIDTKLPKDSYQMNPAGHSHYSGKTGELFTDLSTLTTALNIVDRVTVKVR
ncbi:MAG: hypothetical protein NT092_09410 [Bacteroidia bacterium]|nr:hypothetical protein [Bacteroidia bacterium]